MTEPWLPLAFLHAFTGAFDFMFHQRPAVTGGGGGIV
jgi:hypothetical protein